MSRCYGTQGPRLRAGPFQVAETSHPGGLVLPRHSHASACLHFVLSGVYQETTTRGTQAHCAASLLYKPVGELHSNRFPEQGARTLRIEWSEQETRPLGLRTHHLRKDSLGDLARRILAEYRAPDPFTPLAVEGLCLELLTGLARTNTGKPNAAEEDLVRRVTAELEQRFAEPLELGELATKYGAHRSHLSRAFRAHHRCTMGEYLRRLRIESVKRRLRSDRSIAEIAVHSGFADQSHLTRVFRRMVGMTPGAYRRITKG